MFYTENKIKIVLDIFGFIALLQQFSRVLISDLLQRDKRSEIQRNLAGDLRRRSCGLDIRSGDLGSMSDLWSDEHSSVHRRQGG